MKLKFRIWNTIHKRLTDDCGIPIRGNEIITDFEHDKVMQFIGHKDKKGKEIFVGDILNWDNECTILIQSIEELGFDYEVLTQKDESVCMFDIRFYRSEESAEIIANMYENPELLDALGEKNE